MSKTMEDLFKNFNPSTIYSHSDEITMIFPKKCSYDEYLNEDNNIPEHIFNGKIQKILSILSSYCSVRFNYHISKIISSTSTSTSTPTSKDYSPDFISIVQNHEQVFDARILSFTEDLEYEILNHQIWRSVYDCHRNAIQTYTYYQYSPKEILSKNSLDMIEMLKSKNIIWQNEPTYIKHGIYLKKELNTSIINDKKVIRNKYVFKTFKISFSQKNLDLLFNKIWTDDVNELELSEDLTGLLNQTIKN